MFEDSLQELFKKIFEVKKVSYALPSDKVPEQECLFINVENPNCMIKDGRQKARVEGQAFMFAPADKLEFGYFSKRIIKADKELTKNLAFFDIEANTQQYQNIVQRSFRFVYFFDSQYDPETGSITSVDFTLEE